MISYPVSLLRAQFFLYPCRTCLCQVSKPFMEGIGQVLAVDLSKATLENSYGTDVDYVARQKNVFVEWITSALRSKLPFSRVRYLLGKRLEQFVGAIGAGEFSADVVQEVTHLYNIAELCPASANPKSLQSLGAALDSHTVADPLCNLLLKFPTHGERFAKALQTRIDEFGAFDEWMKTVKRIQEQYVSFLAKDESCVVLINMLKEISGSIDIKNHFGKVFAATVAPFQEYVKAENDAYMFALAYCVMPALEATKSVFEGSLQADASDVKVLLSGLQEHGGV